MKLIWNYHSPHFLMIVNSATKDLQEGLNRSEFGNITC